MFVYKKALMTSFKSSFYNDNISRTQIQLYLLLRRKKFCFIISVIQNKSELDLVWRIYTIKYIL